MRTPPLIKTLQAVPRVSRIEGFHCIYIAKLNLYAYKNVFVLVCGCMEINTPKVTIVCRYIFLRFWLKARFASTKFCCLYSEMVQGLHILVFYSYC
jgi:hypothetical protein